MSPPKSHVSDALTRTCSPCRCRCAWILDLTNAAPQIWAAWSSSGGWCRWPIWRNSRPRDFTYGYVGTQDFTMYPILPPGSFIQVDESRNRVLEGSWRSEYERPIYFVETRDGHTCCWCSMRREEIILQPHPLSPVAGAHPASSPGSRSARAGGGRGYEVNRVARRWILLQMGKRQQH